MRELLFEVLPGLGKSGPRGSRRRLEGIRNNAPEADLTEFFVDSPHALLP